MAAAQYLWLQFRVYPEYCPVFSRDQWAGVMADSMRNAICVIEIINNTRGGIVMLSQSKKGNAFIGGQI